jgi:hypothetical protein
MYVFFVIHHASRQVLRVKVTPYSTAQWTAQQIVECCLGGGCVVSVLPGPQAGQIASDQRHGRTLGMFISGRNDNRVHFLPTGQTRNLYSIPERRSTSGGKLSRFSAKYRARWSPSAAALYVR